MPHGESPWHCKSSRLLSSVLGCTSFPSLLGGSCFEVSYPYTFASCHILRRFAGREEECLETLANLRNLPAEHVEVQYEFRALQAERLVEREAAKERYGSDTVTWKTNLKDYKRLFTTKPLLRRLMIGATAQGLQVGYLAPVRG